MANKRKTEAKEPPVRPVKKESEAPAAPKEKEPEAPVIPTDKEPEAPSSTSYALPGLLPVVPHPPEQPSKLARDIQKAGQPDCREAYGALGLLAVVPLVADSVRDKGCRW